MKTLITDAPATAAACIRRGELAAFPTETVYGLGADATSDAAVSGIFEAKGRPADNPLIVHLATPDEAGRWGALPPVAHTLIAHFWPGPLTLVVPKRPGLAGAVTAGLETVGLRVPRHPVARAFLEQCGVPVAAPSANRSGRPSPTTADAVLDDLDGRIHCLLRGDRSEVGLESTVVDCTENTVLVLRAGAVGLEALQRVAPGVRLPGDDAGALARSPGTRYRHYAPRADVYLAPADEPPRAQPAAYLGLHPPAHTSAYLLTEVCPGVDAYAHALYDFFRRADAAGARVIHCEPVAPAGVGRALMDRLRRAAE